MNRVWSIPYTPGFVELVTKAISRIVGCSKQRVAELLIGDQRTVTNSTT